MYPGRLIALITDTDPRTLEEAGRSASGFLGAVADNLGISPSDRVVTTENRSEADVVTPCAVLLTDRMEISVALRQARKMPVLRMRRSDESSPAGFAYDLDVAFSEGFKHAGLALLSRLRKAS